VIAHGSADTVSFKYDPFDRCIHKSSSYTHLGAPDKQAASGGIGDAAMMETVGLLRAFKSKCLSCCQ